MRYPSLPVIVVHNSETCPTDSHLLVHEDLSRHKNIPSVLILDIEMTKRLALRWGDREASHQTRITQNKVSATGDMRRRTRYYR